MTSPTNEARAAPPRCCRFCGRDERALRILIVPDGERDGICDQCVRICLDVIFDQMPPTDLTARAAWHQQQRAECLRQIGASP